MKTVFLRAMEADDKATALRAAIAEPKPVPGNGRFEVDPSSFAAVPRSPFAYWVSERMRQLSIDLSPFQANGRVAAIGASTKDDGRFVRAAWEVPCGAEGNVPFAKGGRFQPFYDDIHLCLRWRDQGAEAKTFVSDYREAHGWSPHWKAELHNPDLYFRPGLTWPRRTQGGLSFRALPAGCIFADKGPAAFVDEDDPSKLMLLLALVNSSAFGALVDLQMAFGSYEVGVIQRTPVPAVTLKDQLALAALAGRAWSLRRSLDTRNEASHAFVLPALLQGEGVKLLARADAWGVRVGLIDAELAQIQTDIDRSCFDLYGLDEADRRAITEGLGAAAGGLADVEVDPDADIEGGDEDDTESSVDVVALTAELMSWAVGVAFGRFDVRLATGERALPKEPGPLDPLPVCSPGTLTGGDGLPLATPAREYPLAFPLDGVLATDPGDPRDLTAAVRKVFDAVFGPHADPFWQEAAALLDPKGHDLGVWLGSGLFEHHLKRYSKSRRKAPILWQLGTPSSRYSVWLYAHRLTRDSLFQVQNDVVAPKLGHEERRLVSLIHGSDGSPSAAERKAIAIQETYVEELRALLDEVKRVAPLWDPTLDDGIVLTMAPLWRLVPQHRAWQKELRAKWGELAAGKYDWSHIAMHVWPERVVPKCATDRSLAIAHGLEDEFWAEGDDGKWNPRAVPPRSVDEVVGERISAAVQAAREDLLEVPVAVSISGRRG